MVPGLYALAVLVAGGSARAQSADTTVDVELFRPHADFYGYQHVPGAATLGHLQVGTSIWGHYSNDPVLLSVDGQRLTPAGVEVSGDDGDGVVDDRFAGNIQLGMGLSRYFSFVVDVPLIFHQDGYDLNSLDNPLVPPDPLITAGAGDVRLHPKVVVVDRDRLPVGLAVVAPVGLPTGNGGSFLGEESVSIEPGLVFEVSNGSIHNRDYTVRAAIHGGYRVREAALLRDLELDNEIVYGAALGFHPAEYLELTGEFHGTVGGSSDAQTPAEALGGMKILLGRYVAINLGGGGGALAGVGSPDWRVLAGLTVAPSFDPNARDADKDGIVDAMDQCPKDPEDLDAWRDEDGCPEPDNDNDGLYDADDRCPTDAEDADGWQDSDGCPDADNDKDGILDVADRCVNDPENANGYQDDDGCPDEPPAEDTDGDGYKDDIDRCPYDAEDFDGYQDEDGCPELDNDSDGIPDTMDACPLEREIINGIDDTDGCPDEGRVVVEAERIQILDKIYFDYNKATIKSVSFSLLDEIAAVIRGNPQIKRIRIEGHTDSDGSDVYNLKLSQSRAESVRAALIERGVEADRLLAVGFGEQQPVVPNDSDDNKARNRRVEFIIIERQ
ncbi:OmpA family protein [Myxococcota bacterium]|nr:OmpA family protein [Myxococcota bacterium]